MQAILMFSLLSASVILLMVFYDFRNVDLGGLLFLSVFLCCIFISKNIFDQAQAAQDSEQMAKSLAEDLMFSSRELYTELYNNSPVPYLMIDYEGQVKSANIAAVRMLGVPQSRVEGLNIFSRLQCNELEHLDLLVEKYRNGLSVSNEEVRVRRSDDSEAWALLSLFRVSSIPNQHLGLLTLVDVTKQKVTENAKSEFVSLASHQLRTPIAGMKWSAELLLMDSPESLSDRQKKYIERLLTSIRRMGVLVDDFLRVSRFELGTFQAEYATVSLTDIFKDILAEQAQRVSQKSLEVKTFFDASVDTVVSDPNLIRMIVTNLYSNAVKYTREGGTVHIGFGQKDDAILITVADNGMGIPAVDQESIFTKLFRASNAVRDVPDGTGLGLYIVKQATQVLKGSVTFSTVENIGTTFEVMLPLVRPEDITNTN